jgi:hypothetical protein
MLAERKRTEEEFFKTHPEYKQQQPQGAPSQGLQGIPTNFLNTMMQAFTNPAPTSSPLMEKYNLFMEKKLDLAISELANPPESPFEELGREMVKTVTAKVAAQTADKLARASQ